MSLLSDSFNEPSSNDPTSTPPLTVPKSQVPMVLGQKKKKNPNQIKSPSNLARAISQSQRARQTSHKYGQ